MRLYVHGMAQCGCAAVETTLVVPLNEAVDVVYMCYVRVLEMH